MKKIKTALILSVFLLLTACQASSELPAGVTGETSAAIVTDESQTSQTLRHMVTETLPTEQEQQTHSETLQSEEQTPSPADSLLYTKDYFMGLTGEKVYYKDASKITYCDDEITFDEVIKNKYRPMWFFNWTYAALPGGITLNSYDNEYDKEKGEFIDAQIPDDYKHDYFIVSENDEFGGLTVNYASIELYEREEAGSKPDIIQMQIGFSGEKTVTGYITAQVFEGGYMREGNIYFHFDKGQWDDMPILVSQFNNGRFPLHQYCYDDSDADFYYQSDTPLSNFGSILTDYPDMDLSVIPLDGSWAHVKVTITDIFMDNAENREYIPLSAKIIKIEEIP